MFVTQHLPNRLIGAFYIIVQIPNITHLCPIINNVFVNEDYPEAMELFIQIYIINSEISDLEIACLTPIDRYVISRETANIQFRNTANI